MYHILSVEYEWSLLEVWLEDVVRLPSEESKNMFAFIRKQTKQIVSQMGLSRLPLYVFLFFCVLSQFLCFPIVGFEISVSIFIFLVLSVFSVFFCFTSFYAFWKSRVGRRSGGGPFQKGLPLANRPLWQANPLVVGSSSSSQLLPAPPRPRKGALRHRDLRDGSSIRGSSSSDA